MHMRLFVLAFSIVAASFGIFCSNVSAQADTTPTLYIDPAWDARINLGPAVNTQYSELFPVVTPDGTVLYFTRKSSPDNTGYKEKHDDEDIWYSLKQADGTWSVAKKLEGPLNTATYDGVRAVNNAGTHLYLQNIYRSDGSRAKGFSISERNESGIWSYPTALDIADYSNDTNTAMMTVSNSEKVIVFSLLRKRDSKGKRDLYVSFRTGQYKWTKPKLISELSTAGDEISPFIAYDDRTMYFSTDGLGGYGGHDLFVTHRLDSTWLHWSKPANMGKVINTPSFDAYFMVTAQGDTAYFSSTHLTSVRGFGKSDIWKIGMEAWQRPGFDLPSGVSPTAEKEKPNYNIPEGVDLTGTIFRLENVFFDVDKYSLRTESQQTLDRLVTLMKQHPAMEIEVQGHTDADASSQHNLELSKNRANAVREYLVQHGIDGSRVEATGYGETQPIASNNTQEGKQLNRRVMVLIKKNS